jgi:tryptophan-rich sensory protein
MTNKSSSYWSLLLFILIVAGVSVSGMQFQPGEWYAQLVKPGWTPSNWLFPVAWSLLYLQIAVAGWFIYSGGSRPLKILWAVQLILNGLWSWIFFGMHSPRLAFVDILAMFICISAIVWLARKVSRVVVWLMTPYLVWVGYASTLNAGIYYLNISGW